MGIPAYFSFIVKNHLNIIQKFQNSRLPIENLYLDANSIIYDAIRNIDFATLETSHIQSIIDAVIRKICSYVDDIKPTKTLMIALDGVAPVAKLEQQRQRRFKSQYQLQVSRTVFKTKKTDPFNTTAITPGTLFMKELNKGIRSYFINPESLQVKSIHLNLSDVPGEGEHKIFNHMRDNLEEHAGSTTVIYGLDADLIMLSLNHLHITEKIYLFRETPEFIKSISADLEPNKLYYLDIHQLAFAITEQMTGAKETYDKSKILDYILICFFLGNDFMPHFPALNIRTGGIHKVLGAYSSAIKASQHLVNEDFSINWPQLREFVTFLASNEEQYIIEEYKLREKHGRRFYPVSTPEEKMAKFDNLPSIHRDLEKKINPLKHGWHDRYYLELFSGIPDQITICTQFLQMLEWNIQYYSNRCIDWRFQYHFHYPPLLQDLLSFIPTRQMTLLEHQAKNPVSELIQLCYVLPRNCLHLLPQEIHTKLLNEKDEWYVNKCNFIWPFCRYFWECHADLPWIDITELEHLLTKK